MTTETMSKSHLVTATDKRSARYVQESQVLGDGLPVIKLGRFNVAVHLHVPFGWPHVLAKCDNINVDFA
jgi:hypothetical protein